jgi:integrase
MPRRSAGPRLYLDPVRLQWAIRDGQHFIRTGCGAGNRGDAEKALASYIGAKHKPAPSGDPLIDDVLTAYGREHAPKTARNGTEVGYAIGRLLDYWSGKRVSGVTARACRGYPGGRRHLETLRAAIRYWHREYGPLHAVPVVVLPPKGAPRNRWLTRAEAARLLWASRRHKNIKRFILLGLYTGSRAGVLLALDWTWIDFERGVMLRKAPGEIEHDTKRRPPVKLGRRILSHLRRWRAADGGKGRVVHYQGRPMWRIYVGWETVVTAAGMPDVTPHVLRHTRATWLMQAGAGIDIWQAAGHLGMSPRILESTYGHHHPSFQDKAAEV